MSKTPVASVTICPDARDERRAIASSMENFICFCLTIHVFPQFILSHQVKALQAFLILVKHEARGVAGMKICGVGKHKLSRSPPSHMLQLDLIRIVFK